MSKESDEKMVEEVSDTMMSMISSLTNPIIRGRIFHSFRAKFFEKEKEHLIIINDNIKELTEISNGIDDNLKLVTGGII